MARTARVVRRTIGSTVKATGVVKPRVGAEVKVGSRVSGVVARLHVRIGDTVRRGQLLAELETRELAARRDQAAAALAAAEATRAYARSDLQRRRALGAAGLLPAGRPRPRRARPRRGRAAVERGRRQPRLRPHAARLLAHRRADRRRRLLGGDAGGRDRRRQPGGADLRDARRPGAARGLGLRRRDRHRPHPQRPGRALHRRHLPRPRVRGARHRHLPAGGDPRQRRQLRGRGDLRRAARAHAAARR